MKKFETKLNRIDREAAAWVVRCEDAEQPPAPKEQSRWFGWLQRSPKHLQSYLDTADLYERLSRIDPDSKIDVDEWIAGRRAPVVTIAAVHQRTAQRKVQSGSWRQWWWGAAAAASLGGVAAAIVWALGTLDAPSYQTQVGQQSVNQLPDGSIVNLNTHSRVKVRFSDTQRLVELDGEALFTVAKDPDRPFLVRTSDATVQAIGTKFNVYEQPGETRVAVVDGAVKVMSTREASQKPLSTPALSDRGIVLAAGEAARVSRKSVAKLPKADVEMEVAWQKQKLVFEDAPLAHVAAQFNRYNERQFRIEGPIGESKRLSGTFDALHPQSLLLYLQKDDSIFIDRSGDDVIVRAR